jgi:hypothetical protein
VDRARGVATLPFLDESEATVARVDDQDERRFRMETQIAAKLKTANATRLGVFDKPKAPPRPVDGPGGSAPR